MYLTQNVRRLRSTGLICLLATMAILLLAACGGASSAPATPTKAAGSQATPTEATSSHATPTEATSSHATSTGTATSSSTSSAEVHIKIVENNGEYAFSPATVTIAKGTKVVWTNTSDAPHTVTSDTADAFTASPTLTQNQTYSFVFNTAGTYAYHCTVHPSMKATIIVKA